MGERVRPIRVLVSAELGRRATRTTAKVRTSVESDGMCCSTLATPCASRSNCRGISRTRSSALHQQAEKLPPPCSARGSPPTRTVVFYVDQVELVACLAFWASSSSASKDCRVMKAAEALVRSKRAADTAVPKYLPGDPYQVQGAAREIRVFRDASDPPLDVWQPRSTSAPKEFTGENLHMESIPGGSLRGGQHPRWRGERPSGAGRSTGRHVSRRRPTISGAIYEKGSD